VTASFDGTFKARLPDKAGLYRAVLAESESAAGVCVTTASDQAKHGH
jgi:hypothetical protein